MTRWIDNSIADRLYILDHVSSLKDITPESVEKDWWVTAVLQCVFELTAAPYMYFKGGTSGTSSSMNCTEAALPARPTTR